MTENYGQDPAQQPEPQSTAVPPPQQQPEQQPDSEQRSQEPLQPSPFAPPRFPQPQYTQPQFPQQQYPQQQYPQQQYPQQQYPPQQPAAQYPQPPYGTPQTAQNRKRGILVGSIIGGVLLVAAAAVTAVVLLSGQGAGDVLTAPAPTSSPKTTPTPTPAPERTPAPAQTPQPDSAEPNESPYGPNDPEIGGTGSIRDRLEAFKAELKQSNDDGTLWEKIPENKENIGAYLALQFLLTDMSSATLFGEVPADKASYYAKHAKHLEGLLLAQQPLGTSVHYEFQDGRVFDYNGDTGEIGLTEPTG